MGDGCDADVPVMTVLGKEIATVPRVGLVQQIVQEPIWVRHSLS